MLRNRFSHTNLKNYLMPIIYNSEFFGQPAQALPTDEKMSYGKELILIGWSSY